VLVGASAFDRANRAGAPRGSEFARWCARGRPPADRFLLALAAEFHRVDEAAALERLDALARPAFGIASLPHEDAARRLIEAIGEGGGMRPGPAGDPEGLMLDRVLARGRGRPELLAVVYLEVARRAGMSLALLSSGLNWFVGFEDAGELVLVAPASFDRPRDRIDLQRHCPHGLVDAVLGGLTELFGARGARADAAHALALRRSLRAAQRPGASGTTDSSA
jgi:Transglutaminase-like superfamily